MLAAIHGVDPRQGLGGSSLGLAIIARTQKAQLTERPPLEQFLSQKDEILADEQFPDDNKYDPD